MKQKKQNEITKKISPTANGSADDQYQTNAIDEMNRDMWNE